MQWLGRYLVEASQKPERNVNSVARDVMREDSAIFRDNAPRLPIVKTYLFYGFDVTNLPIEM